MSAMSTKTMPAEYELDKAGGPSGTGPDGTGPDELEPADAGMATAEYAIATLAACGFAALLVVILRSDDVRGLLMGIIQHALSLGS